MMSFHSSTSSSTSTLTTLLRFLASQGTAESTELRGPHRVAAPLCNLTHPTTGHRAGSPASRSCPRPSTCLSCRSRRPELLGIY
ncbi:hypothetical protein C8T65DRAFT_674545 [Cerioporus squamosus]|nr:hypothetical protein C8T65DRAFT_674545 [Cerioporus squamosus]